MDSNVGVIADYADALRFDDLPVEVVHQCKRCVVDTFGVAIGAFDAEPSRIARNLAQRANVTSGARIIGTAQRTLPEVAAFANGVMARYLEGNDMFKVGGGHPSDVIAAVLAAADTNGANGRMVITAITLAYEVYHNIFEATRLRDKGMDNVFYTVVGGAVGAAKALGLDRTRIVETISLAITPNIALDASRHGHVSMWKGCAGANAARNGVFAALLAAAGMTGPDKTIEGSHGLENLVGKFKLSPFAGEGCPFRITETTMKCFLTEGGSISPIMAALELSRQIAAEDIDTVTIYTYWFTWNVIGREPEKWRPATREAADHSMPYIVSAVLVDRAFSDEIFSKERLRDPRIHQLMDKIVIKEDPELTRHALNLPCRIEITTKSGERKVAANDYPRGHPNNPMTDDEVDAKFRSVAKRTLPPARIDQALAALWHLDTAADLSAIFEAVEVG